MSLFFKPRGGVIDSPAITTYKAVRAASQTWFPKIMQHPAGANFDIKRAARKMGMAGRDGVVYFDDESESAVLMDYYLFEFRPKGKSLVESGQFSPGELTPLESEWQAATLSSRTSLFEVAAVKEGEKQILLRDILDKTAPELWLTDIGLAASFARLGKALMFTRVIAVRGLHMTCGYSFVFESKHEFMLVDAYRRALWSAPAKSESARRMVYFFDLNRKIGIETTYSDVVVSPETDARDG